MTGAPRSSQRSLAFSRITALAAAALLVLGVAACATADNDDPDLGVPAPENETEPEPISIEMLTPRLAFTDELAMQLSVTFEGLDTLEIDLPDASYAAVARITIQPEAMFPWHTHPGPVLVNIAEGDFVYILADDCVERAYTSGEALLDAGGDNVHTARNPSTTDETIVLAVFLGVPGDPDEPLTIPVDEAQQEALNEECNL